MVATADVVTDRISAYRIPESAVLFRGDETYVFGLAQRSEPLQVMFWELGKVPLETAVRIELDQWIDQGDHLLVPSGGGKARPRHRPRPAAAQRRSACSRRERGSDRGAAVCCATR